MNQNLKFYLKLFFKIALTTIIVDLSYCKELIMNDRDYSFMISYRNLGLGYFEEERYTDAVDEFQKIVEINPKEPLGYANLGISYMQMNGELELAEKSMIEALKLAPDNPDISFLLAKIYELTNRDSLAISTLRGIIQTHPEHVVSLYQLGIYFSRGIQSKNKNEARTHFKKISSILPSNIPATLKLVELLLDNNNSSNALFLLQTLQQTLPKLSEDSLNLLKKILELLHNEKTLETKTPLIMFHNLMKPTDLYKTDLKKLRGTKGPISGTPLYRFLNTKRKSTNNDRKDLNDIQYQDISEKVGLGALNKKFKTKNPSTSDYPITAIGDYDMDGDYDLYTSFWSENENRNHQFLLENNNGIYTKTIFLPQNQESTGKDLSASFIDINNDGYLDLLICNSSKNRLYNNQGGLDFSLNTNVTNINQAAASKALFFDFDLEGDLDFFLITKNGNQLFRNNADDTYIETGVKSGITPNLYKTIDAVFSDFDDDGDSDILLIGEKGRNIYYDNLRQGYFKNIIDKTNFITPEQPGVIKTGDYNNDGMIDLFITDSKNKEHKFFKNIGNKNFIQDTDWNNSYAKNNTQIDGFDAELFDSNNDGYLDLLVSINKNNNQHALAILYNNQKGQFNEPSIIYSKLNGPLRKAKTIDYDNDGDLDIFLSDSYNQLYLFRNNDGNLNNYLKVQLTGLRAGSSKNNYFGIGSKVELKAGDLYQLKYVTEPVIHFGIGERDSADIIRVVWSNGVPQNHFKPQKNQTIVETQVLKGSCPYLFGWTGNKYEFITDVLWPSALGMPLGIMAGEPLFAFPNSTDEYLKIQDTKLKVKENKYYLQFTTELWETPYLDNVKLLVIDHPKNVDVFINETFIPPPYPEFRIHSVTKKYLPSNAKDERENDQLDKIKFKDNLYVANFSSDLYQGVTELHDLTLEFDNLPLADSLFLFLQGWLFPTDASINVLLSQTETLSSIFPYLQVPDENGEWVTIIKNLGFPKGKNKTMIIDMTNKFISDDYRIRIRTNMQIYWDHIFIAKNTYRNNIQSTELSPTSADLHYRGFSDISKIDYSSPHIPDYYSISKGQKWRDLIGDYTRYGDVLSLLIQSDNKYVIMNSGDEITLTFNALNLPNIPKNWSRDFFFYNDGWLKDGDLNTNRGQTVEPLPFHGMESYPDAANGKYPSDSEFNSYRKEYNTRKINDEKFKGFLRRSIKEIREDQAE